MYARTAALIATLIISLSAGAAEASYFDGKQPLLCSIYQLYECDHPNSCVSVTPGQINAMSHLDIDFRKKLITRAGQESAQKSTRTGVSCQSQGAKKAPTIWIPKLAATATASHRPAPRVRPRLIAAPRGSSPTRTASSELGRATPAAPHAAPDPSGSSA